MTVQRGQVFALKAAGVGGEQFWAYRYRTGGRGTRRVQRGTDTTSIAIQAADLTVISFCRVGRGRLLTARLAPRCASAATILVTAMVSMAIRTGLSIARLFDLAKASGRSRAASLYLGLPRQRRWSSSSCPARSRCSLI